MQLENAQHAQQNEGVDLPEADAALPVEVDIDNGTVTAPEQTQIPAKKPAAEEGAPAPAHRPLPRPQARIQSLTHERDQWQGAAERLQQELAEARRAAAEAHAAKEQAERVGMDNLVARTKAEVAAAEAALLAAEEGDDPAAKVAAQKRLARAAAEEADADAWTAANPKQAPGAQPAQQQQQQRQQPQEQPPLAGPVRDFIQENAWFNPVQIGPDGRPVVDRNTGRPISNPDFDEELHNTAMLEDQKIQREIRLGKLAKDYLGSPEYFQRVAQRVQSEFPDAFEGEEEETPTPQRGRAPQMDAPGRQQAAAPSNRQIPGQNGAKKGGTKMQLNGEEAGLVRSLVDNGTMIYPRDHPDAAKRGQKMSYNDAYLKYAREKQTDQANRGGNQQ